jgi:hypothetical protein
LDHLNADYLKSGRGPDLDLWSWDDIDGRHPFLDAPFSWQTQLDLYQTVTTNSELLLLGRWPAPRFQTVAPIGGDTTTWGRENRVPESADPIIVSARIERSLAGRLRSFLFRSNPLFIEVTRRSGKTERYRAPRANFADGVIINQLPGTLGDLAVLGTSGCTLSDPVVSFQFETASRGEFEQPISLEWARLVRGPELPANCVQITQTSAKAPVWGGFRSVAVSAGAATSWTATANESWVVLPQEPPRNGNAAVGLTVLKNSGAESRLGTVTFGGRAFKVLQAGSGATFSGHGIMQFGFYASPADVQLPRDANFDLLVDRFDAFSAPKGQPVLGDWTGSGVTRIGMFRDGRWYLDLNGNGRWDGKDGGDGVFSFGLPGDIAVPGDWAGDGKTRLGVFRHGEWAFDMNGNLAFDRGDKFVQFGIAGDIPVVSKWSHDRMDRVGVYRDGEWIVDSTGDGVFEPTDERFGFGLPGDKPLVSFGNGKVGVYRNGTCILGLGDTKAYDPKTAMTILCGPSHPLIAAW